MCDASNKLWIEFIKKCVRKIAILNYNLWWLFCCVFIYINKFETSKHLRAFMWMQPTRARNICNKCWTNSGFVRNGPFSHIHSCFGCQFSVQFHFVFWLPSQPILTVTWSTDYSLRTLIIPTNRIAMPCRIKHSILFSLHSSCLQTKK